MAFREGIPGKVAPEGGGRFHAGEAHLLELVCPPLCPEQCRRGIATSQFVQHLPDVVRAVSGIAKHDDDPQSSDIIAIVQAVPAFRIAAWMQETFLFPTAHR